MQTALILGTILCLISCLAGCRCAETISDNYTYPVPRASRSVVVDANWEKNVWQCVAPLELGHYMGQEPSHRPRTQAKLIYDDENLYVIFRVEDRYVRAVATGFHSAVSSDSCVEFFFSPAETVENGYFNLEMNCGGTFLFRPPARPNRPRTVALADCQRIEVAHSLPKKVEPEIVEPTTWTVEYRLPLAILENYGQVARPAPGVVWRANFYKCADKTSHPHWLTWAPVDNPQPRFHLPEFFGRIVFTQ